ncbi:Rz1-like lysis system protein LysC, partial [Escherichia coli]|uniref:Rz1-like lysis system protein LysC n=1 Tax=Escherichia coli TaxID=562 RepID=UPI00403CD840
MQKKKLQPPLLVTIAALVLCLPLLLTGCGNSKNETVPSVVILPETDTELTEATPVPPMPQPLTWGASLLWNA